MDRQSTRKRNRNKNKKNQLQQSSAPKNNQRAVAGAGATMTEENPIQMALEELKADGGTGAFQSTEDFNKEESLHSHGRKKSENHEQLTQLLRKSNAFVEKMEHTRQNSMTMLTNTAAVQDAKKAKHDDDDASNHSEERDEVLEIEDAQIVVIDTNNMTSGIDVKKGLADLDLNNLSSRSQSRAQDDYSEEDDVTLEQETGDDIEFIAKEKNNRSQYIAQERRDPEMQSSPSSLLKQLLGADTSPIAKIPSHANRKQMRKSQQDPSNSTSCQYDDQDEMDQLDEDIEALRERMLMNQMPQISNLRSVRPNDIRNNIRAFMALLDWKETKSMEIRQDYRDKLRKATNERDVAERKCQRLEERFSNLDKQKYSLELKNKEMEDSAKKIKRQSTGGQGNSTTLDQNMRKLQRENTKKEKEIQRLQDQLDKVYGRHSQSSAVASSQGPGRTPFQMAAERTINGGAATRMRTDETEPMLQRLSSGSYPYNSLGIVFQEEGAVPHRSGAEVLQLELNCQIEANNRLKAMVRNLTRSINNQINKRMDVATLQECRVSQDLIDEIEQELSPFELERTDDDQALEQTMQQAVSIMGNLLKEALTLAQECSKMDQSLAHSNDREANRPNIKVQDLGQSSRLEVKVCSRDEQQQSSVDDDEDSDLTPVVSSSPYKETGINQVPPPILIKEEDVRVIHHQVPRTVEKEKAAMARTARDSQNVVMAPIVVVAAQDQRRMTKSPAPHGKEHAFRTQKFSHQIAQSHAAMLVNRTTIDSVPGSCNKPSSGGGEDILGMRRDSSRVMSQTNFLTFNRPKPSILTDRSLTIDQLVKVHESMDLSNFCEPTDEQLPNRPKKSMPLTEDALERRKEIALESTRLSCLIGKTETFGADSRLGVQF